MGGRRKSSAFSFSWVPMIGRKFVHLLGAEESDGGMAGSDTK